MKNVLGNSKKLIVSKKSGNSSVLKNNGRFKIGDKLYCKQDFTVDTFWEKKWGGYVLFKKGTVYKILETHDYYVSVSTEVEGTYYDFHLYGKAYIKRFSNIYSFFDYFYTQKEARKLKLKKLLV